MDVQDVVCPYCSEEFRAQRNGWGDTKCPNCGKKFKASLVEDHNAQDNKRQSFNDIQTTQSANYGYTTLLSMGKTISALGWVWAAISIIAGIVLTGSSGKIIALLGGLAGAIPGVVIVASGQLISCFVSMERGIQEIKNKIVKLNKGNS